MNLYVASSQEYVVPIETTQASQDTDIIMETIYTVHNASEETVYGDLADTTGYSDVLTLTVPTHIHDMTVTT